MNPKDYAQLLDEVLADKGEKQQDEILARFKKLLTKNKDTHLAGAVAKELGNIQEQKEQENITYITSSSELSGAQKKALENIFPGPREFSENPSLLGGISVRQKDRVYNSTLKKKMESLKSSL